MSCSQMRCNHCPKDKNAGRRGRLRQINQVPFLVFDHNTKVILPTPTHGFIVPIMAERISTKLDIPQPAENCTLVGVLERLEPNKPTHGRKIALVGPCCASLHMTFRLIGVDSARNDGVKTNPFIHPKTTLTFCVVTKITSSRDALLCVCHSTLSALISG